MTSRFALLTAQEQISDAVLSAAAAQGVGVDLFTDADQCLAQWAEPGVVLVGSDRAATLAALGPKRRPGVFLVGPEAEQLARWSVALGGQVIALPEGVSALSAVLAEDREGGPVVCVLGGSGGVGASTLAAGLALTRRRRGGTAALVDLDPLGGGIDLLLGAERTPGWRWPSLVGARGEVTDVRRFLPQVDGLTVVSMGRHAAGEAVPGSPSVESVRAVLGALARHHDLVVVDAGRSPVACVRPVLAACRRTLLVAGTRVREVAAASAVIAGVDCAEPAVVVRASPGSRVPPDVVARALGLQVLGGLPDDRTLVRAAEQGDLPGRHRRGRWARSVDRILTATLAEGSDGH